MEWTTTLMMSITQMMMMNQVTGNYKIMKIGRQNKRLTYKNNNGLTKVLQNQKKRKIKI